MFGLKKRALGRFARRRKDRQDKGRDIVLARRRVLLASSVSAEKYVGELRGRRSSRTMIRPAWADAEKAGVRVTWMSRSR